MTTSKWPHAPCHLFSARGTYMVTASTLYKQHLFCSSHHLDMLQRQLFEVAMLYGWRLEAWALFANHYHLIARIPEEKDSLRRFINHFHSLSARELNEEQGCLDRRVWFQYWDTCLTYQKSYFARLNYVMQNPVKHHLVEHAEFYPWCSARWFAEHAESSYQKTVTRFKTDLVQVQDDF